MSSQVVRIQSFSKGSLNGIGKEVERDSLDLFENRNEDIDKKRTHMNEFYKHTQNGMYGEWKDICKELNVSNVTLKKNGIAFEGMVVTSDKTFFDSLGYIPGEEPNEKVKEFFQNAYEFAKEEIGFHGTDENILTACVHYDETTPHLQLYYVPVVDSWKEKVYEKDEDGKVLKNENGSPIQARDDKGKIIYNEIEHSEERRINRTQFWQNKGGKNSYSQMQDRFYEKISEKYGLERGERGSTREHTTKAQWQLKEAENKLISLAQNKQVLEGKIKELEGKVLSLQEVNEIKIQKPLLPLLGNDKAIIKMPYQDAINLQNTAKKIGQVDDQLFQLQREKDKLKVEKELFEKEKKMPMAERMEIAKMKEKLRLIERALAKDPQLNQALEKAIKLVLKTVTKGIDIEF